MSLLLNLLEWLLISGVILVVGLLVYLRTRDLSFKKSFSRERRDFIGILVASLLVIALVSLELLKNRLAINTQTLRETYPELSMSEIFLTIPYIKSRVYLEEALLNRKSYRDWKREPIDIEDLSIILWSSYGVVENIDGWFRRTSPSAGATYPMEIYVVVGSESIRFRGSFLEAGVYKYNPVRHSLKLVRKGDFREELYRAALYQEWVRDAPVSIVICAVYERTTRVYGERGYRYVYMEAGHVGQNIYLMTTALGLGTVAIGAFIDSEVARVINAERDESPLYIFPVGVPRDRFINSFESIKRFYEMMRSE
ncbi:MAG: SagB/ThcOx family dehydrogenase [Sulfolobales archaeon]